jgi:pimeloyl-ACP methyl ester carboxylesterase
LVAAMRTILSDADVEAVERELGDYLVATFKRAVANGVDGWVDDDLAFVAPWGFDVAEIDVPTLVVQGRQDLMVPYAHGEWLAAHVRGAESRFSEEEGHLTQLLPEPVRRLHAWLVERSDV